MKKVFIVILNWNQPKLTIECLESVRKLSVDNFHLSVIVVDNHSDDDSVKRFKNIQKGDINMKIIENSSNLGFAGGNNIGIKYALNHGADYVMVLNNDTSVHPDLLIQIVSAASNFPNLGAASPKIYFEKGFEFHKERYKKSDLGKVIWYAGGKIDWNNVYGSPRGVDEIDKGRYNRTEETEFATGTCIFLTKAALEKVGLFNEKYFMYYEDTELSLRMRKAGFNIVYVPDALVWHKVAQSSGIGSSLNDYFTTRNRLLFGMKYASLKVRLALYRESLRFVLSGRPWQKKGVLDYYFGNLGKGSWK